jgi:hypothetical protein
MIAWTLDRAKENRSNVKCCTDGSEKFTQREYIPLTAASSNTTESTQCSTANQTASQSEPGTTLTAEHDGYVKQSVAIGIGAGLGVPLLCALAAIAFLLFSSARGRKKDSVVPMEQSILASPTAQSPQSRQDGYSYISAGDPSGHASLDAGKPPGSVQQRPMAEMYSGPQRFEAPT